MGSNNKATQNWKWSRPHIGGISCPSFFSFFDVFCLFHTVTKIVIYVASAYKFCRVSFAIVRVPTRYQKPDKRLRIVSRARAPLDVPCEPTFSSSGHAAPPLVFHLMSGGWDETRKELQKNTTKTKYCQCSRELWFATADACIFPRRCNKWKATSCVRRAVIITN